MMIAEEFEEWRIRMGISARGAAAALGVPFSDVIGFADWSIIISDEIEARCATIEAIDAPPTGPLRGQTDAFRSEIIALFPVFAEVFEDAMRFGIRRMFTPHGLLSEFSAYYIDRVDAYDSPQVEALFDRIETIFAADPMDRDGLANAIATCFLENISCTQAGEAGRPLMGPACIRFFMGWHSAPYR